MAMHASSVTEVPHNIESLLESGNETFCFFETWMQRKVSLERNAHSVVNNSIIMGIIKKDTFDSVHLSKHITFV